MWSVSLALASLLTGSISNAFSVQQLRQTSMSSSTGPSRNIISLSATDAQPTSADFSSVKGIIFDVDGTLADSWKLGYDATVVVLERNGVPTITEEIYHDFTRYCTPERMARHAGLEPSDTDFDSVGQKLGDEFDEFYVKLVDTNTAGFYPGIETFLNNVPSDVNVGALTNACVAYAHAVLAVNCPVTVASGESAPAPGGIYDRFLSIHGADDVPKPKPNPEGLYLCCKDMGLAPEECIYIGDSPSDGRAAEAAGMPSIGVLWGSHPEESLRNAPFSQLCSTVDELVALLPRK